jgi:predicted outer membrane repeat protein
VYTSQTVAVIVFVLCLVSISSASKVIYVDLNGPNDPGTGSFEDPFLRIQDAIDSATGGDIVEIRPGLYTGSGNYNLDPAGKGITLRSTEPNNPDITANTIIDPNSAGRIFNFYNGEDANCVVSGLTIRNGYTGGKGGGIFCFYSSPTIKNCVISGNSASLHGGAIFCQNGNPHFIGCTINGNSAGWDGGAMECWTGVSEFTNCIITDNHAQDGVGGGFDCFSDCDLTMTNCTIAKNSANSGGAVFSSSSYVIVKNCIVWANETDDNSQIAYDVASIVSVSYSDIENGWPGPSDNIDTDPCFASFDPKDNFNKWDFHLQSAYGRWEPNSQSWINDSNTSLCIDSGDPNSEWGDEPWPNGKRINMGAHGGSVHASMYGNPADFDINGSVNFIDFTKIAVKWGEYASCIEDLSKNGMVESADLRILVHNWLWQQE